MSFTSNSVVSCHIMRVDDDLDSEKDDGAEVELGQWIRTLSDEVLIAFGHECGLCGGERDNVPKL